VNVHSQSAGLKPSFVDCFAFLLLAEVKPKPRKSKKKGSPLGSLLGAVVAVAAGVFVVANSKRKPRFYEVKEGDTLCSIAGCFRLSVDELYDNNVDVTVDPDKIYPGDKFYIP
jgi:hypothetical protein